MDRPATPGGAPASIPGPTAPTPPNPPAPLPPPAPQPHAATVGASTRDSLFSARVRPFIRVEEPGYGTVRMASLTQGQWEELNNRHEKPDGTTDMTHGYMAEAIAAALVEEDGSYVFAEMLEGAKVVRPLPLPITMKLWAALAKQTGMTQEARDDMGKDSGPTPGVDAS